MSDEQASDELELARLRELAKRLRTARAGLGEDQKDIARRAGIARSTYIAVENKMGNPTIKSLWAIADALDVPVAQLLADPPPDTRSLQ